ncbi:unnamed protein product, partial [Medioppia subpectinata]
DSKSETNGRSESTAATRQPTSATTTTTTAASAVTTDDQSVDNKITVIQSNSDSNCAQIQTIDDSLTVNSTERQTDDKPRVDTQDVHMKSAESVECLATTGPTLDTEVADDSTGASSSTATAAVATEEESVPEETVKFKVVFNKTIYEIEIGLKKTGLELKQKIQTLTSVAPAMQKLVLKGIAINDTKTLSENGIKDGVKVLLVGCRLDDVIAINATTSEAKKDEPTAVSTREPLCKQKQHKKVLDRGLPEDVMPAWKNGKASLPPEPLHGMVNKYNNKVRLTFKLEADQLWIGTKERTDKLPMQNIRSIVSEPIDDHPEYHLMGIQTGPTEASRIWLYWVPSQFVDAIKDTILGK